MTCDTRLKQGQSISERKEEVKKATDRIAAALASGRVKAVVDKATGAIAFDGIRDDERDGVTDACAYRRILVSGSATAKAALARAEMLAGRSVSKAVIGQGMHSHDGGKTWHNGH